MPAKRTAPRRRPILPPSPGSEQRFWSNVNRGDGDECWPWTASLYDSQRGYGGIMWNGRNQRAHRVAYALSYGIDPGKQVVRHDCDNPPCCNPAHLRLGTQKENMEDASRRGRMTGPCGTASPWSKLTEDAVRDIRASYRFRVVTKPMLAERYGVSVNTVKRVLNRKAWAHVA